jgi:hypothetical protein
MVIDLREKHLKLNYVVNHEWIYLLGFMSVCALCCEFDCNCWLLCLGLSRGAT